MSMKKEAIIANFWEIKRHICSRGIIVVRGTFSIKSPKEFPLEKNERYLCDNDVEYYINYCTLSDIFFIANKHKENIHVHVLTIYLLAIHTRLFTKIKP